MTSSRPDLVVRERVSRASFAEVAGALREVLGAELAAYIAGVPETREVKQWAAGDSPPSDEVQLRLRVALQVALLVAETDGREVAHAWFQGLNPELEDRSPARLLRDGDLSETAPAILDAARLFLTSG